MWTPVERWVLIRLAANSLFIRVTMATPVPTLLDQDTVISFRFPAGAQLLAISSRCGDIWRIRAPVKGGLHPSSSASLLYIPRFHQSPCSPCVWMAPPHCQPLRDGCFPYRPDQDRRLAPGGPRGCEASDTSRKSGASHLHCSMCAQQ